MPQNLEFKIPEGYVFDKDNSTDSVIRFKPIKKTITYQDVKEKLFADKEHYVEYAGTVNSSKITRYYGENIIIATSPQQIEQLLALNKLMNVAKYFNDDWKLDFTNGGEQKWYIRYDCEYSKLKIDYIYIYKDSNIYFKSEKLARQAIEILGEKEVKKALGIFE